jgi:Na+/melibiose symporter-like transporter
LVRQDQLTTANSTNNLGGLISQVVGFAVLPPFFLNTVGPKPLFFIAAVLFGVGGAFFLMIRHLGPRRIDVDSTIDAVREVRKQFAQAWERLSSDVGAYMSVIIVVLASTASLVAVTLMPRYTQDVLDIPVRNAVFVFLPAALGILAGLRLVQWLERRMPKVWLVGAGFGLLAASFVGLTLVKPLAGTLEGLNPLALFDPGPFGDTTARIVVTIVFSTAAAFSFSVLGVASRALVNERMPLDIQGRVFAAQHVLTNLASILPILLAGLLAELFGVELVLGLVIVIPTGIAGWTAARAAARSVS